MHKPKVGDFKMKDGKRLVVQNFAFGEMQALHVKYTKRGWVGVPVTMPTKLNARMTFDELMQFGEEGQAAAIRKVEFEERQRERERELFAQGISWWLDKAAYGMVDDGSWLEPPTQETEARHVPSEPAQPKVVAAAPQGLSAEFLATLRANRVAEIASTHKQENPTMPKTIDRRAILAARQEQLAAAQRGSEWQSNSTRQEKSGSRTLDQIRADRVRLVEQGRATARGAR